MKNLASNTKDPTKAKQVH